jgi:hypothetical protein
MHLLGHLINKSTKKQMDQQFFWSRVLSFLHLSSHEHPSTPYSQSFTSFLPSQNPSSQLLPSALIHHEEQETKLISIQAQHQNK